MGPCPAALKAGGRCKNNGHSRDGYLCHLHRGAKKIRLYSPERERTPPASQPEVTVDMLRFWKRVVRCEHLTPDGQQCGQQGRAMFMLVDGKIRCQCHGGGRRGRTQVEALREIFAVSPSA